MYSQNDEEQHILKAFEGRKTGRFLEIGACDGKLVSNTLALVERGWSGIMVEPSPRAFLALRGLHGLNPRLTLVNAAVGLEYGFSQFWEESTIGGYSTTEEGNRSKWQHLAKFGRPFYVPMVPLSALLGQFPGPIDLLSIDTEGTSVDLFLAFPFDVIAPKVVCVEHDGRVPACKAYADLFWYREVARNAENLVLVREEY